MPNNLFFRFKWATSNLNCSSSKFTILSKVNSVESILNNFFENTAINYYIYEDKIILTTNSIIYNTLPNDYFKEESISVYSTNKTPVFYNDYTTNDSNKAAEILIIGKQNKNSSQSTFILSGSIKNENTNEPIQNMVISIKGKNSNTVTYSKGDFSIKVSAGLNVLETNSLKKYHCSWKGYSTKNWINPCNN